INFQRVDLVDPSADELMECVGEYFSKELSATYQFAIKEGRLWLRVGSRRWERLDATVRDEFTPHVRTSHENRIIRFRRDKDEHIVGFSISFWRVKAVEFKKQKTPRTSSLGGSSEKAHGGDRFTGMHPLLVVPFLTVTGATRGQGEPGTTSGAASSAAPA